jgi:hypothetical protein
MGSFILLLLRHRSQHCLGSVYGIRTSRSVRALAGLPDLNSHLMDLAIVD